MKIAMYDVNGAHELELSALVQANRCIFIDDAIDMDMARDFAQQVMYFAAVQSDVPVKVFINSPGGMIAAGLLMYDVIQASPVPLELYCLGWAYSMAAILFACGRHGRYLLPHSKVMIHEPAVASEIGGKTSSIRLLAMDMAKTKDDVDDLLARHTGHSKAEIDELTKEDRYFTAQEAVDFGLADGVMDFATMLAKRGGKR